MGLLDTWLDDPRKREFVDYFREYPGRVKEEFVESAAGIKPEFGAMGTQPPALGMAFSWLHPWLMDMSTEVGEKIAPPFNEVLANRLRRYQSAGMMGDRELKREITGEQLAPVVAMAAMWPFGGRKGTPFNPQAFRTAATNVRSNTVKALEELSENIGNIFNLPQLATPAGPASGLSMMSSGRPPRVWGVGGQRGRPSRGAERRRAAEIAEAKRLAASQAAAKNILVPQETPVTPLDSMIERQEKLVTSLEHLYDSLKERDFRPDLPWIAQKGQSASQPKGIIDPEEKVARPTFDWKKESAAQLEAFESRTTDARIKQYQEKVASGEITPEYQRRFGHLFETRPIPGGAETFPYRPQPRDPRLASDPDALARVARNNEAIREKFGAVGELRVGSRGTLEELKAAERGWKETGVLTWNGEPISEAALEEIMQGIWLETKHNMDSILAKDTAIREQLQSEALAAVAPLELGQEYTLGSLVDRHRKALEVLAKTKPLDKEYLATASERGIKQTKRHKAEVEVEESQKLLSALESGGEQALREVLGGEYAMRVPPEFKYAKEGSYFKLDDQSQKGLSSIGLRPEHFEADGTITKDGQKLISSFKRESASDPEGKELVKPRIRTAIETGHLTREDYWNRGTKENYEMLMSMTPMQRKSYLIERAKFRSDREHRQFSDPERNYINGMKKWGFESPEYQDPLTNEKKRLVSKRLGAYQELQENYKLITTSLNQRQQGLDISVRRYKDESDELAKEAAGHISYDAARLSADQQHAGLWEDPETGLVKEIGTYRGKDGHLKVTPLEDVYQQPRNPAYPTYEHMHADTIELPDHDVNKLFEYAREKAGAPSEFMGGQGQRMKQWRKAVAKEATDLLLEHSSFKETHLVYRNFLEDQEHPPLDITQIRTKMKRFEDLARAKFNMTIQFEFIQADKWGRDDFDVPELPEWIEYDPDTKWGISGKE